MEVTPVTDAPFRVIDAETTRDLLPIGVCIYLMADAMRAVSMAQSADLPRSTHPLIDGSGFLGAMLGSCASPRVFGLKFMSVLPGNPAVGRPLLQGGLFLFDPDTGAPSALVDGSTITALRTAATSALSARLLARPDASTLAVLGYGVQAAEHLDAMLAVRPIDRIVVWGRSREKGERFCHLHSERLGLPVVFQDDAERACASADIVCTATSAKTPILSGEWIRPGTHVVLIGSHDAGSAEADSVMISRATVFVDHWDRAARDAGEIAQALATGAVEVPRVARELGDLVTGALEARTSPDEITLFKSIGLLVQDLIAGSHVAAQARVLDRGHLCPF
jgi:alanine dehydrogenase